MGGLEGGLGGGAGGGQCIERKKKIFFFLNCEKLDFFTGI